METQIVKELDNKVEQLIELALKAVQLRQQMEAITDDLNPQCRVLFTLKLIEHPRFKEIESFLTK